MNSNPSENNKLLNEIDPLTDECIASLSNRQKINTKKKIIEDLISFFSNNPNYITDEQNQDKLTKLFQQFTILLNENNNNFILVEIALLNIFSSNFKKNSIFSKFLLEILPKLFDKFNLQNTKINKELIDLFNNFISNNLKFSDFIPFIENVSIDDDDNYKSNILEFLFSQIKIDDTLNMKTMPHNIIELLKKLSDDEDNEVSNFAFNSLEALNIRSVDMEETQKVIEDNKESIPDEKVITPSNEPIIQKKEEIKETENNKREEEKMQNETEIENFVVEKKQSKSQEQEKAPETKEEEIENFVVEKKKPGEEKPIEPPPHFMKKNVKGKNRTFRAFKNKGGTATKEKPKTEEKTLTEKKANDIKTPIKNEVSQNQNEDEINKELTYNERSNSKDENNNNPEVLEQIQKIREENIQNKYLTYDDRAVGGKSETNDIFKEEMERLKIKEELNKLKEEKEQKEKIIEKEQAQKNEEQIKQTSQEQSKDKSLSETTTPSAPVNTYNEYENRPIGGKKTITNEYDEKPICGKKPESTNEYDERPICGKKKEIANEYDEKPVGGNKTEIKNEHDEMPIGGNKIEIKNENDERPICGKKQNEEVPVETKSKNPKIAVNLKKAIIKHDDKKVGQSTSPGLAYDNNPLPKRNERNDISNEYIQDKSLINQNSISQPNIFEEDPIIASNDNTEGQIKSLDDFQKLVEAEMKKEQENKGQKAQDQNEQKAPKTPIKKEDPKYDEIKAILGDEIVQNLDDTKWENKKAGFEGINTFVQNTPSSSYKVEDLIIYLKFKLKDFKETNFNLIKEAINIFNTLIQMKILNSDNCLLVLNAYYEKIADIKLKEHVSTLINNILDIVAPDVVLRNIIGKLTKKNNVKLLIEYSNIFGKLVEDYDVNDLPIKELTDYCKIMAANSNPQVRTAATGLLCVLYKWIGSDIKIMIKDIKESTLKIIEAEFEKVVVVENKDKKPKKEKPKTGNDNEQKKTKNNELIPRVDISKKINPSLLKDIKDGKWPEKKEACEAIEKIIVDSNMKILPNGLGELFNLIKSKLSDGNKNIVRMSISLLTKLIEALSVGFKQYSKPIALALIPNLADKMQMLRDECQVCLDKWVSSTGFDTIIYYIPSFLKTDNFDIRTEIFKFINKHRENFNKAIGEAIFKEMVSPLMICIQDKSSSIRASAEEIIIFSQQFIPLSLYYKSLKDFKPVIANGLRQTLDKLKRDDDGASTNTPSQVASVSELPKSNSKEPKSPVSDEKRPSSSIKVFKKNRHQLSNDDIMGQNKGKDSTNNNNNHLGANSTVLKSNTKGTNSSQLKKNVNNKLQVYLNPITVKTNKEKRYEIDKKYKFSLDTINPDYENKLRDQLKSLFSEDFLKKIFSDEFKSVVEAINCLKGTLDRKENINYLLDNLDLIFKMVGIKFMSNQNPSMMKAFFEFLDSLVQTLTTNNYAMNDTEINIIIPLLVEKLSITNSVLKEHVVFLLNHFINIIGANKATLLMLNTSLNKNQKIKSEILDLATDLYLNDLIDINTRQYARVFSKFLSVNDNNVKAKTIALFKEIYAKIGDELWSYIDLNEKEREFLESNLYEYGEEEEEEAEQEEDEGEEDGNTQTYPSSGNNDKYVHSFNQNIPSSNTNMNPVSNYETNQNYQSISNFLTNSEPASQGHKITVQQHLKGPSANYHTNDTQSILNTTGSIRSKTELVNVLRNLLTNDPTERVNTIIIIHELICPKYEENKTILIANIDYIIKTFVEAMKNLFSTQKISEIPIKFAKYLATVLCKIASNKELISSISYDVLFELSEELLSNLLIENLDKIGNNQEGSIIFKSLNSTMLRILENCNSTYVILSLLELIRKYRCNEEKNKLAGLSIKCLLKVNQNLEAIISTIEVDKILLQIHILLVDFEKSNPDLHPKNQTDQVVIKYIKNLINEMVKIKKNKIIEDYADGVKNHEVPDKYIIVWIKNCLTILQVEALNEGLRANPNENCMSNRITIQKNTVEESKNKFSKVPVVNNKINKSSNGGNSSSNYQRTSGTHDFNNTISELKKKWNDVNKKSNKKK